MKFTLMSYHYLRYPIRKYLDKMERVGLDGIDIYCTGPQLNPFDYSLGALIQLNRDIRDRHLTPYVLTAENCVYPVNLATSDLLTWESTQRYYQRLIDLISRFARERDIMMLTRMRHGNVRLRRCSFWRSTPKRKASPSLWRPVR